MKGIILKDLYENFYIKKNLASYIFGLGFVTLMFVAISAEYTFVLYVMLISILFGSCMLEASYEQDEKANFYKLQFTFPVTKTEVVLAKYLLALASTSVSALLALAYSLFHIWRYRIITLPEALTVWGLSICVSLIFTSVVYLFYFLFGKKIGIVLYVLCAAILGGIYRASSAIFGIDRLIGMDPVLLCVYFPVSIALFALSCLLSAQIYKRRYS